MNEKQGIKDIDLSKMSISQLKMCINSFYGYPEKYINTPEYREMYQKIIAEMQKRSNMN